MKLRRLGALLGALALAFASVATVAAGEPGDLEIKVEKTASVYNLPFGGGEVSYNYVVTNRGEEDLEFININDDKCAPVVFLSGDQGGDGVLGEHETWVYECGPIDIDETTKNTVVVSGCEADKNWDNAQVAFQNDDCVADSDDVRVRVSDVAITVDKTANHTDLAFGGGSVTFTYVVDNPGEESLDVEISDDKCSPLVDLDNPSGDADEDDYLDPDETWTFTCTKVISASQTNTVSVEGCEVATLAPDDWDAETMGHWKQECVEDTDSVTVNVSQVEAASDQPTLPPTSTTFGPSSNGDGSIMWIAGILAIVAALALVATPRTSRRRR